MILHQHSGRWKLGLLLTLGTTLLWGFLPVALKIILQVIPAPTLVFYRMLAASLILGLVLTTRGKLNLRKLSGREWICLLVAGIGLAMNYLLYVLSLKYITPANAQVFIQFAPFLLAIGGITIFHESFNRFQWLGLALLFTGFSIFFKDQLVNAPVDSSTYFIGVILVLFAALTWAVYALFQKQLLATFTSSEIMLGIYAISTLIFLPFAKLTPLLTLSSLEWLLLIFCCLNTLLAYGFFSEALNHWEASRVSAICSLTPFITIGVVFVVHQLNPELVQPERLGLFGVFGALFVVSGSALVSFAKTKPAQG